MIASPSARAVASTAAAMIAGRAVRTRDRPHHAPAVDAERRRALRPRARHRAQRVDDDRDHDRRDHHRQHAARRRAGWRRSSWTTNVDRLLALGADQRGCRRTGRARGCRSARRRPTARRPAAARPARGSRSTRGGANSTMKIAAKSANDDPDHDRAGGRPANVPQSSGQALSCRRNRSASPAS